jgi:molybdopterin molybdotransferase
MSYTIPSVSVEEALAIILDSVAPTGGDTVSLFNSCGRILFEDIVAGVSIPPENNSAMDGYAVRSADITSAGKNHPAVLRVIGEIKAGEYPAISVTPMTAVRIMTGALVPPGCDAVVPMEDTDNSDTMVRIYKAIAGNDNIRLAGEDISSGMKVLRNGDTIRSAEVGLLASLNIAEVPVYRQPIVAILSTGDEVLEVGDEPTRGKIRNSNAYTLYSEVERYRATPQYLGIIRDTPEETRRRIIEALEYDVVITSGGVSMGKYDFVKTVMSDAGITIKIDQIRMKPGRPLVFGVKGKTLFFALPGNPVSVMISFLQFVRPALIKMMGGRRIHKPVMRARMIGEYSKKTDRVHFIRGRFQQKGDEIQVSITGPQGSGILRSMSEANCLILLPEDVSHVATGDWVSIQLMDHEEV